MNGIELTNRKGGIKSRSGRRRVMNYGPSIGSTKHSPRIVTNVQAERSRFGVILRKPVHLSLQNTTKSVLRKKIIKGTPSPGFQPPNYPSPLD